MNIFDKPVLQILESIKTQSFIKLKNDSPALEITDKNPFLMERDTAIELGGYPKESINIYVPSSNMQELKEQIFNTEDSVLDSGVYCIGNPAIFSGNEAHISFGKIVLLETEEIKDEDWYGFTQKELLTDSRIRIKDVMLRQSSTHYNVNFRVSKTAMKNGFTAEGFGKTIQKAFYDIPGVKSVTVILIFGENPLYKQLLEKAERIKEITLTLNHIFDGIDMDCGHCNLVEICNEVEGMRKLHKKKS